MYLVEFFYLVSILGKEWRYAYAVVVVFQLEDLMEGVEYTSSRTSALDDSWNADNMRIVVASLVSEDDGMTYICANSVSCPLGGSAGYDLNE